MSDSRPGPPKGPGRPRSERAHEAILEATLDLLVEEGFSRMSIEAVAIRAGVGKATIYRRWTSKADLVAEAVACLERHKLVDVDSGSVRQDLVELARQVFKHKESSEVTDLMIKLMSARARHPELQEAFLRHVIEPRRQTVANVLRRGIERGEIRADIDVQLAIDVLMGFVSYRSMLSAGHRPSYVNSGIEAVIDLVLDGIAAPEAGATRAGAGAGRGAGGRGASKPQPRAASSSR